MGDARADESFDIDARTAQITGKPPRIDPLTQEEMPADTIDLIMRISVSAGFTDLSKISTYFRTMIKHPELFRCQVETGTVLFSGKIDGRERELAILRIAWLCRAPYEWGEHVLMAKMYGVATEEIARVIVGASAPGWSDHEAAILRGVEELLDDAMISDETWATLAETWSEPQLVEFPTLVGVYVTTAFQQNTLRMRLKDSNAGLYAR